MICKKTSSKETNITQSRTSTSFFGNFNFLRDSCVLIPKKPANSCRDKVGLSKTATDCRG